MLLAAALLFPQLVSAAPADAVKVPKPGVQYRMNVASASSRPWVNANGWLLQRGSAHPFFYDVAGPTAALAGAEAFAYQRDVTVHADAAGSVIFGRMITFLKSLGAGPLEPLANVGIVDDGSAETGEMMKLLARHNLLFRIVHAPGPHLPDLDLPALDPPFNIQLGSADYPKASAANPETLAQKIRERITDDKRILRIYGSDVVLARVNGDAHRLRLHLINYSDRPVYGVRVRLLGAYSAGKAAAFEEKAILQDFVSDGGATEFTLPELKRYAVIDLASR